MSVATPRVPVADRKSEPVFHWLAQNDLVLVVVLERERVEGVGSFILDVVLGEVAAFRRRARKGLLPRSLVRLHVRRELRQLPLSDLSITGTTAGGTYWFKGPDFL